MAEVTSPSLAGSTMIFRHLADSKWLMNAHLTNSGPVRKIHGQFDKEGCQMESKDVKIKALFNHQKFPN